MKARSIFAFGLFLALTGACQSEDSKSDNSQALEIQSLDRQVNIKVVGAQDYISGLEEDSRTAHATVINQTLAQYNSCSESGRKSVQAAAVHACADSFQSNLKGILKTIVDEYRRKNAKSFEDLNGQVLALADKGTVIGKDLEKVQQTYKTCQDDSLNKGFQENSGRLLRACELTVEAEIVRLDTAVKMVDVDVLDTF
jgi:hypothetical protein